MPRHDRYDNRSVGCVYTCLALLFGNYLDTDRDIGSLCTCTPIDSKIYS